MKILGISGSSKDGGTDYMLRTLLEASGCDYEIIPLRDMQIFPCKNCKYCHKKFECGTNDDMKELYLKIKEADLIVFASPTYFDNVSGYMKNFMDRLLPYYFSKKLVGKKAILLTCAGFGEYVELDDKGKCKWHKECISSAKACLRVMRNFCDIMEMEIVEKIYTVHGDPTSKKNILIKTGKKLS